MEVDRDEMGVTEIMQAASHDLREENRVESPIERNVDRALAVIAMEVVHPRRGSKAVVAKPNSLSQEPRMNIHKHARMTSHGRLLLVQRIRAQGWRVAEAAAAAGVSVRTAYKWLARHRITATQQESSKRGTGWEALHVAVDDASRLAYTELLPNERKHHAIAFLEHALAFFAAHGVAVERVMTDNGSAYKTYDFAAVRIAASTD